MKKTLTIVFLASMFLSQNTTYSATTDYLATLDTSWKPYANFTDLLKHDPETARTFVLETEQLTTKYNDLVKYKDQLFNTLKTEVEKKQTDQQEKRLNSLYAMSQSVLKQIKTYEQELKARENFLGSYYYIKQWFDEEILRIFIRNFSD